MKKTILGLLLLSGLASANDFSFVCSDNGTKESVNTLFKQQGSYVVNFGETKLLSQQGMKFRCYAPKMTVFMNSGNAYTDYTYDVDVFQKEDGSYGLYVKYIDMNFKGMVD